MCDIAHACLFPANGVRGGHRDGLVCPSVLQSMWFFVHPPITLGVSAHLQPNYWLDWTQIWWANSLWDSPGLINWWWCSAEFPVFPGLWLVQQFPHFCRQFADQIELKLWDELVMGPQGIVNLWLCSVAFLLFPGLWFVEHFSHNCRQTAD